ncbi:MAG: nicotinate phosphoribosyltransferase, partial [Acidimicrobiales bacterium]
LGHPTSGLVYKLVSVDGAPVAKQSPGKATVGGRKWAWRVPSRGEDVVGTSPAGAPEGGRALQVRVVASGERRGGPALADSRAFHQEVLAEHPPERALATSPRPSVPRV